MRQTRQSEHIINWNLGFNYSTNFQDFKVELNL